MKKITHLFYLFLILAIAGCSKDDAPTEPDPDPVVVEPPVLTGVFLDSEVAGVTYTTETQTGTTNAAGEFRYVAGEEVTFSVGDIELGSAEASDVMTPVTIASTSDATLTSEEVMNIAAFLQTLDADNDPSNGITIEQAVVDAITTSDIDFTGSIVQLLGEIVAEVNQATGGDLVPVYPQDAAKHLAETLNEEFTGEDFVFGYFVPTIESWTSYPRTSLHWIHETDENGKLVKSVMYERFPYRVIREYTYLSHNENGQPTSFEEKTFYTNGSSQTINKEVSYSEDHRVSGMVYYLPDGSTMASIEFTALDESLRITEAVYYNSVGDFMDREVYVYNEDGNNLSKTRYNSLSGTNEADMLESTSFEYTDFGDLATRTVNSTTRGVTEWEYLYRADHTKKEAIARSVDLNNRERTDHYYYDETEVVSRLVITVGDYVSDYVSFYENGDPKRVETTYQGFLYEIVEFNEDGSSVWKTINEADSTYKIEYKDVDGTIQKTEYYDAEGNLVSTETA